MSTAPLAPGSMVPTNTSGAVIGWPSGMVAFALNSFERPWFWMLNVSDPCWPSISISGISCGVDAEARSSCVTSMATFSELV